MIAKVGGARRSVHTSITRFRGIGQHFHPMLEESGKDGKSYAAKFDNHAAAAAWVLGMAKKHFPVKTHRLIQSQREGPWFYRAADDS